MKAFVADYLDHIATVLNKRAMQEFDTVWMEQGPEASRLFERWEMDASTENYNAWFGELPPKLQSMVARAKLNHEVAGEFRRRFLNLKRGVLPGKGNHQGG